MEKANLYVEKCANGELLLDFINEDEFLYFKAWGDYLPQEHMAHYQPSQLLLHNAYNFRAKEGSVLKFSMKDLWRLRQISNNSNDVSYSNIYLELDCDDDTIDLLNGGQKVTGKEITKLQKIIGGTWQTGLPCALKKLRDKIAVIILDVGQGSANFICDASNLTIFDFGTSIYAKASDMSNIVKTHCSYFNKASSISLIISHWDCDHYNLLTSVDDAFLKNLCCVFVPDNVISLTAKSVVKRLEKNCKYIRTFSSPNRTVKRKVGMQLVATQSNYDMFIGEKTTDINNSGLALAVHGSKSTMMLTADHSTRQVWDYMYPQIISKVKSNTLNLTVPHHGGNCGTIKSLKKLPNAGAAVVSVGQNSYKHPNQKSLDFYESVGFKIMRTDWYRKDIIINL